MFEMLFNILPSNSNVSVINYIIQKMMGYSDLSQVKIGDFQSLNYVGMGSKILQIKWTFTIQCLY